MRLTEKVKHLHAELLRLHSVAAEASGLSSEPHLALQLAEIAAILESAIRYSVHADARAREMERLEESERQF